MHGLTQKNNKELLIKLSTEELNPTQVRLIKSMNALMAHLLTSDDEAEYFEGSAELLKKAAEVIKASHFTTQNTDMNYGSQAVEFAVDYLNESLEENKIQSMDN
jgi:hypothetical protein